MYLPDVSFMLDDICLDVPFMLGKICLDVPFMFDKILVIDPQTLSDVPFIGDTIILLLYQNIWVYIYFAANYS